MTDYLNIPHSRLVLRTNQGRFRTVNFLPKHFSNPLKARTEELIKVINAKSDAVATADSNRNLIIQTPNYGDHTELEVDWQRSTSFRLLGLRQEAEPTRGTGHVAASIENTDPGPYQLQRTLKLEFLLTGTSETLSLEKGRYTLKAAARALAKQATHLQVQTYKAHRLRFIAFDKDQLSTLKLQATTRQQIEDLSSIGLQPQQRTASNQQGSPATLRCNPPSSRVTLTNPSAVSVELHLSATSKCVPARSSIQVEAFELASDQLRSLIQAGKLCLAKH